MFNPPITLEKNKKFSESGFWQWQREYFDQQGIDAWVNQVPFYVTSNPFIANGYASVVMSFVRDWIKAHPEAKEHPFYIIELGTGSGRFSFYTIKKIQELRRSFGLEDIKIRYVMSDFTKHNIQYWESHPALQPYIQDGSLDFALYNMEENESIVLVKGGETLSPSTLVNPLTVFANYIFDTVSQDMFAVNQGKLHEILVTLSTNKKNTKEGTPIDWEQVQIKYGLNEIREDYYPDEHLNAILAEYKKNLKSSHFLLPIGGFKAIKKLLQLSNNKLLLLSSDKGYSSLESQDHMGQPELSFHGSFSMEVNFHAIARYFEHRGGDAILQTPRRGIKTAVFGMGFDFNQLKETSYAISQSVEGFSATDYFTLHRRISDTYKDCSLQTLASHMVLTDWDPHMFMRINNRICALIDESDATTVNFFASNMHKLMANFYYMPKSDDLAFEIGVFFHKLKNYAEALKYYQQAAVYLRDNFGLIYNIALCQNFVGKSEEALASFEQALALKPDSKETEEWIAHIKKGN